MKKEIYICDNCERVLSDDNRAETHLSITFAKHSGWVDKISGNWQHRNIRVEGIRQFCDEQCLADYFKDKHLSL